jgi:photosystem II stability/assembly factor-like uncharacterized protein
MKHTRVVWLLTALVASALTAYSAACSAHLVPRTPAGSAIGRERVATQSPASSGLSPSTAKSGGESDALAALPMGIRLDLRAISFPSTIDGWVGGVGVILATHDGGRTWVRQYNGPDTISQLDFVDPTDGWATGGFSLYHTTDGGVKWTPAGEPAAEALQQVHFVRQSFGWGVGDGVLFVTDDGGLGWTRLGTPIPVGDACFLDRNNGWAVNAPGPSYTETPAALLRTTDGGQNWQIVPLALGMSGHPSFRHKLRCAAPAALWDFVDFGPYASGESYVLSHSDDGGSRWTGLLQNQAPASLPEARALPQGPGPRPGSVLALSGDALYLTASCASCKSPAGDVGGAVTTDAGRTWRSFLVQGAPGATPHEFAFADAEHGWMLTSWGSLASRTRVVESAIFATSDGGRTWTQEPLAATP